MGGRVPVSWLYEEARLEVLLDQVAGELGRWSRDEAAPLITRAVAGEASIGPETAMELVRSRVKPFPVRAAAGLVTLRPGEVEGIVAHLEPGAPLERLLSRIAGEHADRVESFLIDAVATQRDPRAVARDIAPIVDGGLVRARTIVRTEMLRTTREAQRLAWSARADVVRGWRWWSTLDKTTCPVCWAMHGSLHPLDEPFGTHPNCRCSMIPEVSPSPELGIAPLDPPSPGPELFNDLPVADQRRVLGPAKHVAYQAGEITLPDLVEVNRHPEWGVTRSEVSLTNARR